MGFRQDIGRCIGISGKASIPEEKIGELQDLIDQIQALELEIIKITDIEGMEHPIKKFKRLMTECKRDYEEVPRYLIDEGKYFIARHGKNLNLYDKRLLEELHKRSSEQEHN